MRRSQFTVDQINACLQQVAQGRAIEDVAAQWSVSVRTIYRWRDRYDLKDDDGIDAKDQLRQQLARCQRRVADLERDVQALTQALVGRYDSVDDRRRIIDGFIREQGMSERHACELAALPRSTKRYAAS